MARAGSTPSHTMEFRARRGHVSLPCQRYAPILMRSRRPYAIAGASLVATALTLGCMKATASAANAVAVQAAVPPKLIVFIPVDQLRGDMLARYRADLHSGYARLMSGAWFVNAYQ